MPSLSGRFLAFLGVLGLALPVAAEAASPRMTVVVSDLHLGGESPPVGAAAHPWEDFRWGNDLRAFLDDMGALGAARGAPVDVVIAGDFLELWQSSAGDCRPASPTLGCSEAEAVERVRRVAERHRADLRMLGRFAAAPDHRLVIVPGNHDAALLFPAAAAELVAAVRAGAPGADVSVAPEGYYLSADGELLVEHGHQDDPANRLGGWPSPFAADAAGTLRLQRPVGEWFVLDFFQDLESRWSLIDNTTDDVAVARWLAGAVPVPEALGAVWSVLTVGHTYEQRVAFASAGGDGPTAWDPDAARAEQDALLWRIAPPGLKSAQPPADAGIVAGLANQELAAICEAVPGDQAEQCPQRGGAYAAAAARGAGAKARGLRAYLGRRRVELGASVLAYVFGHTHDAVASVDADGDPARVVNDGAFQRVVEPGHLQAMMGEADPAAWLEARDVGDLPSCYSFVLVLPYEVGAAPRPLLLFWATGEDGVMRRTSPARAPAGCVTGKAR